MKFFTGYESAGDREERSDQFGFRPEGDSLTVQADAKDADINVIMGRYQKTGFLPQGRVPSYGDFDSISDFREALEVMRQAEADFMRLPAKVRAEFENDAVSFLEFVQDPANLPRMADLGLLTPEAAREIKAKAEVKDKPTDGGESERVAAAAARRKPGGPVASRGGDEGADKDH